MSGWREENSHEVRRYNWPKIETRKAAALQGLLTGVIMDGVVNDAEIAGIERWLDDHHEIANVWPMNALAKKIRDIKADGVVTPLERAELLRFIEGLLSGGQSDEAVDAGASIFAHNPSIEIPDRSFCFTGKLQMYKRADAHDLVAGHGGRAVENVSHELDYLVVGVEGNESWHAGSYGRKIEAVMTHRRKKRAKTLIIRESDFATHVAIIGAPKGPMMRQRSTGDSVTLSFGDVDEG